MANLNVKKNKSDKVSEQDLWQSAQKGRIVKLRGIVTTGVKEAVFFTGLPWVKKQFVDKLGIEVYPGTFNIELLASDQNKLAMIKEAGGVEIIPPDADCCAGKGFPALIGGRIIGAVVIPFVTSYPRLKLEIISSQNIRQALSLKDGDLVEVEVCL
jgi:riboflavin kinase